MPDKYEELSCPDCGTDVFTTAHTPPNDDDKVICAGCQKSLGTYGSLAREFSAKGRHLKQVSITNIFGGGSDGG